MSTERPSLEVAAAALGEWDPGTDVFQDVSQNGSTYLATLASQPTSHYLRGKKTDDWAFNPLPPEVLAFLEVSQSGWKADSQFGTWARHLETLAYGWMLWNWPELADRHASSDSPTGILGRLTTPRYVKDIDEIGETRFETFLIAAMLHVVRNLGNELKIQLNQQPGVLFTPPRLHFKREAYLFEGFGWCLLKEPAEAS